MKYHDTPHQAIKVAGKLTRVKKIAILQAGAPGDFIFTLPALEALRHTYPRAEIVLLGQNWHAAFLRGRPSPIDRVVVVPACQDAHATDHRDLEWFFAHMQAEHFDLALQMQDGSRGISAFLLRLQARVTAGYDAPDGPQLDRSLPYTPFQHEILRWQEIAALVGAATETNSQPELIVMAKDLEESLRVVAADSCPLVVLHPGSDDPRGRWPGQHFAAVGDALAREGMRIVITGSEQESDLATQITRQMRASAQNVAGKLSYAGLCGLLSRCRLTIANDAAIQQLASCVGSATIGLYWCVNMLSGGPLNRLRHRPFISWQLDCPICGHNQLYERCGHLASLITDISSDEVINGAWELLRA
ncbi:glycosyltransferase family 9 protein [Dictyobacter aurantiacus]|uniref:Glycosyl transferase n=1 Tax=Dictyobacter aurantiacus TaxID=1936993 RepID=A0A401ZPB3_9CHLR|nr:glycosyltransferase family 9 protein [Dictyobacter aurantiacus]GCE08719.1 hypothetical protein KDAU_60480 [Dictyobacter aurantiacus]